MIELVSGLAPALSLFRNPVDASHANQVFRSGNLTSAKFADEEASVFLSPRLI